MWSNFNWKDAAAKKEQLEAWQAKKSSLRRYRRQLESVGKSVADLMKSAAGSNDLQKKLKLYAEKIKPWAESTARNMVQNIWRSGSHIWREKAAVMGIDVSKISPDIEGVVLERIAENVRLITSLPLQAAEEVGNLTAHAVQTGMRAEELADKIIKKGAVSLSRAKVIAQTEVSKTQTALTQARAEKVGSEGYIWRTARDGASRPSHAAMEGKFVAWNQPPSLDGMLGHAGEFPNCRCYPEPVLKRAEKTVEPPLPTQAQEVEKGEKERLSHWERTGFNEVIPHEQGKPLFNADKAVFLPKKLTHYSLDPTHPRGKDKARVWKSALGFEKSHAGEIERQVMAQIKNIPAYSKHDSDKYGERFNAFVPITNAEGKTVDATVAWIYRRNQDDYSKLESYPTLVTCFIEEEKKRRKIEKIY